MNEKGLELRMYGLVPYNISPIQQAIQFGHAVVEYGQMVKNEDKFIDIYNDWADNWKTFIILNGGTTSDNLVEFNDRFQYHGSLNRHAEKLKEMAVLTAEFREPDLGDQLTAVVFLLSEKVFNIPTYKEYLKEYQLFDSYRAKNAYEKEYGEKETELKEFISQFRLA